MGKIVEYRNVAINRRETEVLTDVSFTLDEGEFVYLIGTVGSGKSSLMKSLYAEVPVAYGEARIMDYDLTTIPRKEIPYLRRSLGIIFQDFQLLPDRSVIDNLDFVLRATGWENRHDIEQRIDKVLDLVGMKNKGYKQPHQLSGGEQQRVVIARAMLNNPRMIIADEPTGNLDPATGEAITRMLHEISQRGTTVLMATHNLTLVEQFPARVLRSEKGHIYDDGIVTY